MKLYSGALVVDFQLTIEPFGLSWCFCRIFFLWSSISHLVLRNQQTEVFQQLPDSAVDWIKFGNFARKKPYQDLMSDPDLPLPGAPRCNHKIESTIGAETVKIVSMDVYACGECCSQPVGTNIVRISEANYRDNPDLCIRIVFEALLSLPAGFYTVVYHTQPLPCVIDFRVGDKGFGLRVRQLDRETINGIKPPAYLRIEIE